MKVSFDDCRIAAFFTAFCWRPLKPRNGILLRTAWTAFGSLFESFPTFWDRKVTPAMVRPNMAGNGKWTKNEDVWILLKRVIFQPAMLVYWRVIPFFFSRQPKVMSFSR